MSDRTCRHSTDPVVATGNTDPASQEPENAVEAPAVRPDRQEGNTVVSSHRCVVFAQQGGVGWLEPRCQPRGRSVRAVSGYMESEVGSYRLRWLCEEE